MKTIEEALWPGLIMFAWVFLLSSMLFGCYQTRVPPETISIDSDFSSAEAEVIRDAVSAWCDAVEWCPEETSNVMARGRFVRTYTTGHESSEGRVPAYNADWRIVVAPEGERLDMLWTIVAHEIGHWCTTPGSGVDGMGHTDDGLMKTVHYEPWMLVDQAAIASWLDGCL